MRHADARAVLRMRRMHLRPASRTLARSVTVEDLHLAALRRWPSGVAGYVDGGADGEETLRRNTEAYSSYEFLPSTMRDVSSIDTSVAILGATSSLPIVVGPTGYTRMMHPDGERAMARSAATAGIPYTLATLSTTSIAELARDVPADLWFQLYVLRDRGLTHDLVQGAAAAGYRALMVTVDSAVTGLRVRDRKSGFTAPPQLTLRSVFGMARRPAWCARMLAGEAITLANLTGSAMDAGPDSFTADPIDPSLTWDDLVHLRDEWRGPLLVKGMLSASDVVRAADVGVDAVVLSNHGGRQLDRSATPVHALEELRDAVGDRVELMVDSGIRRGTDVATALAVGASAVLLGRPVLYGLGAAGEPGALAAIEMIASELRRAMALLGVVSIAELREQGPALVRRRR
jgi:L-lactate dehydrogenase (cytochrome)